MAKKLKPNFKNVKLLVLDVDGVLTKGEIIYNDKGGELKIFNVKDGLGIFILKNMGINTVLLTARDGDVVKRRAKDMRVIEVIGGILPKEGMLDYITKKHKVKENEICFVGDDLIDIGVIKRVGVGVAVADASTLVKKYANYITKARGGEGAVREIVDLIIKEQKLDKKLLEFLENPKINRKEFKSTKYNSKR